MSLPSLPPIPPSGPSKSDSYPDATPLDLTGILELRVNSPSVRLYPVAQPTISNLILATTAMTHGANSPSTPSICLLRGPLGDFFRYSRQEASKWLIDLAHDICDPADQRGSLVVWKEQRQQWRPVATKEPLTASIYATSFQSELRSASRKSVSACGNPLPTRPGTQAPWPIA